MSCQVTVINGFVCHEKKQVAVLAGNIKLRQSWVCCDILAGFVISGIFFEGRSLGYGMQGGQSLGDESNFGDINKD